MIASHDARNAALSALRFPSVQIPPCHITFDCHFDSPAGLHRSTGRGMASAWLEFVLFNESPRGHRALPDGCGLLRLSPTDCHRAAPSICGAPVIVRPGTNCEKGGRSEEWLDVVSTWVARPR